MRTHAIIAAVLGALALAPTNSSGQNWAAQSAPYGRPEATIDLRTTEGAQMVKGQWRYSDAKIIEVESRGPGADLKPSGDPNKTYDYWPHAGDANFDDSKWEMLDAEQLDARRGGGKVCFNWYRIRVTVPGKVANFSTTAQPFLLKSWLMTMPKSGWTDNCPRRSDKVVAQ